MTAERISVIANWLKRELACYKEFQRFNKFFLGIEKPNGVLTKNGEEINPLTLALITAKDRVPIILNSLLEYPLPAEQQQRIRHAILFSLRGNYEINPLSERDGVSVGISLEDNDARAYLSTNAETTVAFLKYFNGYIDRYQEASSIKTNQEIGFPQVVLDFPNAIPVQSRQSQLYIFTQAPSRDVDKRFTKMILPLIAKP